MKRRLLFVVSLFCLVVGGAATNVQADFLDTPHNDSNNIACTDCHLNPDWQANNNGLCKNCHGLPADITYVAGNGYVDGPFKDNHSSSTTDEDYGVWTTQCTDCHDPHFQGQLDWAMSDQNKLYIVKGDFTSNPTPAGSDTTINFSVVTAQPGFADTSTWTAKEREEAVR